MLPDALLADLDCASDRVGDCSAEGVRTMIRALAIGLAALALGACASAGTAGTAEIRYLSRDKVEVRAASLPLARGEAARGCAMFNRTPVFESIMAGNYFGFACVDPAKANVIPRLEP
jgi:hypothetical protein